MHSVKISFFYTNIFLKRERPEMDDFEEEKNLFVKEKVSEKCQYFQEYLRMQVFLLPYFFRQKPMQKSFLSSF